MSNLMDMKNIGKELSKKLESIGVVSKEDLMKLGAEESFVRLKENYPKVCLVHLYALEGAITNIAYNQIPHFRKKELKTFSEFLKTPKNHKYSKVTIKS